MFVCHPMGSLLALRRVRCGEPDRDTRQSGDAVRLQHSNWSAWRPLTDCWTDRELTAPGPIGSGASAGTTSTTSARRASASAIGWREASTGARCRIAIRIPLLPRCGRNGRLAARTMRPPPAQSCVTRDGGRRSSAWRLRSTARSIAARRPSTSAGCRPATGCRRRTMREWPPLAVGFGEAAPTAATRLICPPPARRVRFRVMPAPMCGVATSGHRGCHWYQGSPHHSGWPACTASVETTTESCTSVKA